MGWSRDDDDDDDDDDGGGRASGLVTLQQINTVFGNAWFNIISPISLHCSTTTTQHTSQSCYIQ